MTHLKGVKILIKSDEDGKTRAPMDVVKCLWERPVNRHLGGPVTRQKAFALYVTATWCLSLASLSLEQLLIAIATSHGLAVPFAVVMLDK